MTHQPSMFDLMESTPVATPMPAGDGLVLRDYQRECVAAIRAFRDGGGRRGLVVLPTGVGKTVIFSQLPSLPEFAGQRTLVIAHREELLDQAADKIQEANPGLSIGIEQASRHAEGSQVVVASVQTLAVGRRDRLNELNPRDFGLIVVDEAHHVTARTYMLVLRHFGLVPDFEQQRAIPKGEFTRKEMRADVMEFFTSFRPSRDAPLLIGVTATPGRTDGRAMEIAFDDIVFSRTISEMSDAGWLVPIRGRKIFTAVDIADVKIRGGDYVDSALSKVVNTPERNALAAQSFREYTPKRQGLVFAVDVAHAHSLKDAFTGIGVETEAITGDMPKSERRDVIKRYQAGEIQVLTNCMVLVEGFDAPKTGVLVMARPTKSSLLYTQMLGRGSRLAPGKDDLIVLDLADTSKVGVADLASLFGLPPYFAMDGGMDVNSAAKAMEEFQGKLPGDLSGSYTMDEIARIAQEFDPLAKIAMPAGFDVELAWIPTPWGYALNLQVEQIAIVVDQLERATMRVKVPERSPLHISDFDSAYEALRYAENWVRRERRSQVGLVDTTAKWRDEPPTAKQIAAAKKARIDVPERATKGQVSALLSAKFGQK